MLAVRCPSSFISAGRLTPARNMLVAYVCRFPDYAAGLKTEWFKSR